jgi:hypothetical protein
VILVKICPYDFGVCNFDCCSWLDTVSGDVVLCSRHGNPSGRCMRRSSVSFRNVSVFNKHLRGGR